MSPIRPAQGPDGLSGQHCLVALPIWSVFGLLLIRSAVNISVLAIDQKYAIYTLFQHVISLTVFSMFVKQVSPFHTAMLVFCLPGCCTILSVIPCSYSHAFGNATSTLLKNSAKSSPYDMATSLHNQLPRYINTY